MRLEYIVRPIDSENQTGIENESLKISCDRQRLRADSSEV